MQEDYVWAGLNSGCCVFVPGVVRLLLLLELGIERRTHADARGQEVIVAISREDHQNVRVSSENSGDTGSAVVIVLGHLKQLAFLN